MRFSISAASSTRRAPAAAGPSAGRRRRGRSATGVWIPSASNDAGLRGRERAVPRHRRHRGAARLRPHELLRPGGGRPAALDLRPQLGPAPQRHPATAGQPPVAAEHAGRPRAVRPEHPEHPRRRLGPGAASARPRPVPLRARGQRHRGADAGPGRGQPLRGHGRPRLGSRRRAGGARAGHRGHQGRGPGRGRRRGRQPDREPGGAARRILAPARGRSVGGPKGSSCAGRRPTPTAIRSRSRWTTRPTAVARSTTCGPARTDAGPPACGQSCSPRVAGRGCGCASATGSARRRRRPRASSWRRGVRCEVLEPGPGLRADAGGAVRLRGAAADARGRRLIGRRLVWRAGRTVLGAGRPSTARCPRARGGSASRRPTGTGGPRRPPSGCACARRRRSSSTSGRARCALGPRGRADRVRDAAGDAAGWRPPPHVGPAARRIRVPVGRARTIRLRLTLTAGGRRSSSTLVVRRR